MPDEPIPMSEAGIPPPTAQQLKDDLVWAHKHWNEEVASVSAFAKRDFVVGLIRRAFHAERQVADWKRRAIEAPNGEGWREYEKMRAERDKALARVRELEGSYETVALTEEQKALAKALRPKWVPDVEA